MYMYALYTELLTYHNRKFIANYCITPIDSLHMSHVAQQAGDYMYPRFSSIKQLHVGAVLLPLDEC